MRSLNSSKVIPISSWILSCSRSWQLRKVKRSKMKAKSSSLMVERPWRPLLTWSGWLRSGGCSWRCRTAWTRAPPPRPARTGAAGCWCPLLVLHKVIVLILLHSLQLIITNYFALQFRAEVIHHLGGCSKDGLQAVCPRAKSPEQPEGGVLVSASLPPV